MMAQKRVNRPQFDVLITVPDVLLDTGKVSTTTQIVVIHLVASKAFCPNSFPITRSESVRVAGRYR